MRYDFDGDGKADIGVFRPSNATWYIFQSSNGKMSQTPSGSKQSGTLAPADYDGDGRCDVAIFRPVNGTLRWSISSNATPITLGETGDVGVPADYDGDGMDDIAVYRPGTATWIVLRSSDGKTEKTQMGQVKLDAPAPADYDGDGKTDFAVIRPQGGTLSWYIRGAAAPEKFGLAGDIPVPADYDGDGKDDLAVYRQSANTFTIRQSSDKKVVTIPYGSGASAKPVPADYDGDGKVDLAVVVDAGGNLKWSIRTSGSKTSPFGVTADLPARIMSKAVGSLGGKEITKIGAAESFAAFKGLRPNIATDSKNQPHIVVNAGHGYSHYYSKLAGKWQGGQFAAAGIATFWKTAIEVDPKDRAWISLGTYRSGDHSITGMWVQLINNAAVKPTFVTPHFRSLTTEIHMWQGNLSLDPAKPDEAIVLGHTGWIRFKSDGTKSLHKDAWIGTPGEKSAFKISRSSIWHAAMGGWTKDPSAYRNSFMTTRTVWAAKSCYSEQGADEAYVNVGYDLADKKVGYIVGRYNPGLVINIWDGVKMKYGTCGLKVLDAKAAPYGNNLTRYSASLAPAKGGGAFVCWTSKAKGTNEIKIQYITHKGDALFGPVKTISDGAQCAITTDKDGQIHIAYVNGGMKYRKVETQ